MTIRAAPSTAKRPPLTFDLRVEISGVVPVERPYEETYTFFEKGSDTCKEDRKVTKNYCLESGDQIRYRKLSDLEQRCGSGIVESARQKTTIPAGSPGSNTCTSQHSKRTPGQPSSRARSRACAIMPSLASAPRMRPPGATFGSRCGTRLP